MIFIKHNAFLCEEMHRFDLLFNILDARDDCKLCIKNLKIVVGRKAREVVPTNSV